MIIRKVKNIEYINIKYGVFYGKPCLGNPQSGLRVLGPCNYFVLIQPNQTKLLFSRATQSYNQTNFNIHPNNMNRQSHSRVIAKKSKWKSVYNINVFCVCYFVCVLKNTVSRGGHGDD